jgi:hypothetical protein
VARIARWAVVVPGYSALGLTAIAAMPRCDPQPRGGGAACARPSAGFEGPAHRIAGRFAISPSNRCPAMTASPWSRRNVEGSGNHHADLHDGGRSASMA